MKPDHCEAPFHCSSGFHAVMVKRLESSCQIQLAMPTSLLALPRSCLAVSSIAYLL